ncbi:UNVERIFIED_CONTAM: hypothetical protein RMT77_005758 [Armadillidium vulgare]
MKVLTHALRNLFFFVAVVVVVLATSQGQGQVQGQNQGFYPTRYGKRTVGNEQQSDAASNGNHFYSNRYGRSSTRLPVLKIRSSRFLGGSRYGKRNIPQIPIEDSLSEFFSTLEGDTFTCILVNIPDIYRCQRREEEVIGEDVLTN